MYLEQNSYLFGEITYLSRQTSLMFGRISFCLDKYMYAIFPGQICTLHGQKRTVNLQN